MKYDSQIKTIEMKQKCERCRNDLELVTGNFPWNEDYLICPNCDSTYVCEDN